MTQRAMVFICLSALACASAATKDTIPTDDSAHCASRTWRVLVYNDGAQGRTFYYEDVGGGIGHQRLGFVERGESRLFTVTAGSRPFIWVQITREGGVAAPSPGGGLVGPRAGDFRAYSNCQ